jgi:hypothetical protein
MDKNITISLSNFFITYLSILTGGSGLSKKELEVMGEILKDTSFHLDDIYYPLLPHSRKRLQSNLGMSVFNFNNYITSLKNKKAILTNQQGLLYVNPIFMPKIEDGTCRLGFNFIIKN